MIGRTRACSDDICTLMEAAWQPADPNQLSFALSYAAYSYEILNASEQAYRLAKKLHLVDNHFAWVYPKIYL